MYVSIFRSEIECRRRWKNIRDRYIKERKLLREKRRIKGPDATSVWKYFSILSFLEPYVRGEYPAAVATTSNDEDRRHQQGLSDVDGDDDDVKEAVETVMLNLSPVDMGLEPSPGESAAAVAAAVAAASSPATDLLGDPLASISSSLATPVAPPMAQQPLSCRPPATVRHPPAPPHQEQQHPPSSKKRKVEPDAFEQQLMSVLASKPDEEELFLLSMAPRLRKLPYPKRSQLKIKFMSELHKAEFS